MSEQGKKVVHKRGHNAMITGFAILVVGALIFVLATFAVAGPEKTAGVAGAGILVAVAGFVTLIVGVGMRRER